MIATVNVMDILSFLAGFLIASALLVPLINHSFEIQIEQGDLYKFCLAREIPLDQCVMPEAGKAGE